MSGPLPPPAQWRVAQSGRPLDRVWRESRVPGSILMGPGTFIWVGWSRGCAWHHGAPVRKPVETVRHGRDPRRPARHPCCDPRTVLYNDDGNSLPDLEEGVYEKS